MLTPCFLETSDRTCSSDCRQEGRAGGAEASGLLDALASTEAPWGYPKGHTAWSKQGVPLGPLSPHSPHKANPNCLRCAKIA